MLLASEGSRVEDLAEARTSLEKAVALNPRLGSAWSSLALSYASVGRLDAALSAAKRAVDTMPGEPYFQYNLAVVLARMERYDEARVLGRKLQSSGAPAIASAADKFLTELDQAEQYAAFKKSSESDSAAGTGTDHEGPLSLEAPAPRLSRTRQNNADEKAAEESTGTTETPAPSGPRAYSMVGTITEVHCAAAPQIRLTLKAPTIVMHLHAGDIDRVAIKSAGLNSAPKSARCASLRGKSARVSYQLVREKDWDGEVVSIEFRGTP